LKDPLSEFRSTKPAPASVASARITGKRPYEAYDKKGRPCPYTEIRCTAQPSQSPQSRFFLAAVFSADFDEAFTLLYSFMAVEVRGRNLREVRQAIQNSRCEFIQEYHEQEFLPPGKDDPVIESIRFITGDKLDDILAAHKAGKHHAG
jgi:hypothetical protein